MSVRPGWSREQLLVAYYLYCRMPFGKMHSRNPEIVRYAESIGRTPAALAMKLTNIASLDPEITGTGRRGLAGASAADRAIWDEMQSDWERFAVETQTAVSRLITTDAERPSDIDDDNATADYGGTNKTITSSARVGQAFFRRAVLSAYQYRCCITGMAIPQLLVASHIVPWRVDAANRLNPRNGLCLSMLHDKAFDVGIICVTESLTVQVSRRFQDSKNPFFDKALLAYKGHPISLPEKFQPNLDFLAYHRENIFEG
ncbi:MAG: HNH endonuclease [Accumulibacter sp.]|jgi:putative restriction endonuclease